MKLNKKATVFVYILVLVSLSLIMGLIITSNTYRLTVNSEINEINRKLLHNITGKSKQIFDLVNYYNSDGSGFIDNISCPDTVTMSGNTNKNTSVSTQLSYSGGVNFCKGTYGANDLSIYFNSAFTGFLNSKLGDSTVILNGDENKTGASAFLDSDNTLISFLSSSYKKADLIDDNFNSDNYIGTSTGTITYADNYIDNDDLTSYSFFYYIPDDGAYHNVFWMNSKIGGYIQKNMTGNLLAQPLTSSGYLVILSNKPYSLKLVKFDKSKYNEANELIPLETKEISSNIGAGLLQNDLKLSLTSLGTTGNEYTFDYPNQDYALFVKNNGTGFLYFGITSNSITGSGIILSPINYSGDSTIEVLGNSIIETDEGKYIGKMSKIVGKKQ